MHRTLSLERPWYILSLALLPLVRFFETNFEHVPLGDGVRFLLILLLGNILLTLVTARIWGGPGRGALVAAPWIVVATFGHALGVAVSLALVGIGIAVGAVLLRWRGHPGPLTVVLNFVLLALVMFPFVATLKAMASKTPPIPTALHETPLLPAGVTAGATLPDIYYIMVDGLGQPDFLEQAYRLPRDEIAGGFEALGFRFAEFSRCNYNQTALSQAATLNAAPVQTLLSIPDPNDRDRHQLARLIGDSRVRRALQGLGYRTVDFPSGYPITRMGGGARRHEPTINPNLLEYHLLRDGALPLIQRLLGRGPADLSYAMRRGRLEYIFDHLADARDGLPDTTPVFVYAHIMAPHPPFVFDQDGAALPSRRAFSYRDGSHWHRWHGEDESYPDLYRGQVRYVTRRLVDAVVAILAASPRPPVIIIQGDHGPGAQTAWEDARLTNHTERMSIFNAWLLPTPSGNIPRADLSAINTFPVLFNELFDAGIQERPERFWFARNSVPLTFQEIGE